MNSVFSYEPAHVAYTPSLFTGLRNELQEGETQNIQLKIDEEKLWTH